MPNSTIPLSDILDLCEALYTRQGFVQWAQVAKAFGISRQAIYFRLRAAVASGHLTEAQYRRWQSASSLIAQARKRGEGGAAAEAAVQHRFQVTVSPEDALWLRTEAAAADVRPSDILAGLLGRARCAAAKGVS